MQIPKIVLEYRAAGKTMTITRPIERVRVLCKDKGGELYIPVKPHWAYLEKFLQPSLQTFVTAGPARRGVCCMHSREISEKGTEFIVETYWWILDVELWKDQNTWFVQLGGEIKNDHP